MLYHFLSSNKVIKLLLSHLPCYFQIIIHTGGHVKAIVIPRTRRYTLRLKIEETGKTIYLGRTSAQLDLAVVQEVHTTVRLREPSSQKWL